MTVWAHMSLSGGRGSQRGIFGYTKIRQSASGSGVVSSVENGMNRVREQL